MPQEVQWSASASSHGSGRTGWRSTGRLTAASGQSFSAGKLGKFTVGADKTILLGPPFVFTKANIDQFNF